MVKVSLILKADAIKLPSACRICFIWTAVTERAQHCTQTEELAVVNLATRQDIAITTSSQEHRTSRIRVMRKIFTLQGQV